MRNIFHCLPQSDQLGDLLIDKEDTVVPNQRKDKSKVVVSNSERKRGKIEKIIICKKSLNIDSNHVFHKECLIQWLMKNQSCPIFRNL